MGGGERGNALVVMMYVSFGILRRQGVDGASVSADPTY